MSLKPLNALPIASSRTRMVQSLSLALWAVPVLASSLYLAVSPLRTAAAQQNIVTARADQPAPFDATNKALAIAFTNDIINGGAAVLQAVRFEEPKGAKHSGRIRQVAGDRQRYAASTIDIRVATFRDVTIIDANHIKADGVTVRLANISPLEDGSMCKRIDGVVESCAERAASRLIVLSQGRTLTCRIWSDDADNQLIGQCNAGRLDIAQDLIRLGLARRPSCQISDREMQSINKPRQLPSRCTAA